MITFEAALARVEQTIEKNRSDAEFLGTIRTSLLLSIKQCAKKSPAEPEGTRPKKKVAKPAPPLTDLSKQRIRSITALLNVAGRAQEIELATQLKIPKSSLAHLLRRCPQFQQDPECYWSLAAKVYSEADDDDDRVRIHDLVGERGAMKSEAIAKALGIPVERVLSLIGHEWFQHTEAGYAVA